MVIKTKLKVNKTAFKRYYLLHNFQSNVLQNIIITTSKLLLLQFIN